MNFYENELKALTRAGRYRTREVVDMTLKDFASNDYLGLAHNKDLHKQACEILQGQPLQSSKASMLVNGNHQIHKEFEVAM